ncbi:Peptidyl-prolyl cis-trans isomerase [Cardinium endosymbiont cEper1 of Encarsia pergandiella]|uniref:FKBP-type peptidyl-prolyl cis-trans isomerase n=1 Tax=Cardinium endosymbiont of Encarsia pergandiella TaxID=249402 RepID=UPI00027EA908|nr:FKBP-type peptidyl-prolyl cis-trans isomerase [Cardinium endosymbiont of Encarsia pergandiella]CCM10446.1 Peptidyl-prolyl cis-trans isomerase [Cardinium endosymbiont cEper1 of Encarsia pergandiella]
MKRKIVCTALVLFLGLVCYNHQYHCYGYPFVTTPSGLSYKTIGKKSSGKKVQDGQWIKVFITMKVIHKKEANRKESIRINQKECIFLFDNNFQSKDKRIAEMIGMMQEKQRVVFKCTPQYYLDEENPAHLAQLLKQCALNQEDTLMFDIKLDKIMTDQEYSQMLAQSRSAQLAKDKQLIIDYLTTHHIQASSTDSGLFYTIDQPSQGRPVVKGQTIKVHYTGRLLDGTIFDTSVEEVAKANNLYNPHKGYQPFEFRVGERGVIQGWQEGLLLLKKHEKARLFIPSILAYGPDGIKGVIPENAILLFEVEVVDLC